MKPGDYVFCIKSFDFQRFDLDFCLEKNKLYKIKRIEDDGYISICFSDKSFAMSHGFELYENRSNRYFHDFFITLQRIRKLKIEKINESTL